MKQRGKCAVADLKLCLPGSLHIEQEHKQVKITSRKSLALLAYLAVSGDNQCRDTLAAMLWPERDQRQVRSYLRNALW